jgi:hypothetical protein
VPALMVSSFPGDWPVPRSSVRTTAYPWDVQYAGQEFPTQSGQSDVLGSAQKMNVVGNYPLSITIQTDQSVVYLILLRIGNIFPVYKK